MNVVGFPNCLDPSILADILRGGADKVKEAGAVLVGGHSVQDNEPKYGLCVSGFVHPKKIFKNYGCRPGDALILTKPIGSGVVNTAVKAEMAFESSMQEAIKVMSSLNKKAKEVIEKYPISACTDVTGFGLLGHCAEMASASEVSFDIREYSGHMVDTGDATETDIDLLYDPQTSGGLLISVAPEYADDIMNAFEAHGLETRASRIGTVREADEKWIYLKK